MKHALVVAGHGSHLDPRSSVPIHYHARRIRESRAFDEVAVAFWKEEPAFSRALEGVDAEDVTIVPLFMASGYFTSRVIPREFGLCGRLTREGGRTIRLTEAVGCHPRIADVVAARASESGAGPDHHLAVIAHGTPRHGGSAATAVDVAHTLGERGLFGACTAVFLDQEPSIATLADATRPVVAVPLFVADGWHAGVQVPGIAGEAVAEGLVYTAPVGLHDDVTGIILDLAEGASSWT
jgi:sirohydrochlorin cobaltochelatase